MIDILTHLPTDAFVTAAFAELIDDVTGLLAAADGTDERAFWRRQQTALNKAQYHFLNGVRPTLTGDAYLMPSSESCGLHVYRLIKRGGVVECDCKAGQNGILCQHHMAINVYERASELEALNDERAQIAGRGNDATPIPHPLSPIPHAAEAAQWVAGQQLLAQRLTATAQYVAALRSAQRPLDPPGDNPLGDEEGDSEPPDRPRQLGVRLVQARKKSAYFASAFYLAA